MSFWTHPTVILGDMGPVESRSVCLEMVLLLVQDRSRFAPHVPLAHKSFWTQPMVLLADEAQVEYVISVNLEIVLILTQHRCPVCAERTIGSKIVLDAPDGTPR